MNREKMILNFIDNIRYYKSQGNELDEKIIYKMMVDKDFSFYINNCNAMKQNEVVGLFEKLDVKKSNVPFNLRRFVFSLGRDR